MAVNSTKPMRITILGCGTSGGVPQIGPGWGDCDAGEPKNRRRRSSVFVEVDGLNILIDTSPDCREQLLDANITHIDAVLYTHAHADHCHGIDDLRWICHHMGKDIPIYGDGETMRLLQRRFEYAFTPLDPAAGGHYYKPVLHANVIDKAFNVQGLEIIPFEQDHGFSKTMGYRIGNFAYSTDVVELDENAFNILDDVRLWVVDALQPRPHPTHAHLEKTLGWIAKVKPEKAYLTHMNMRMDYQRVMAGLPSNVEPAWDGLAIEVS